MQGKAEKNKDEIIRWATHLTAPTTATDLQINK